MTNTVTVILQGYNVGGVDMRDGGTFEDFYVASVNTPKEDIIEHYEQLGYNHVAVEPDGGIQVIEFDALKLYLANRRQ